MLEYRIEKPAKLSTVKMIWKNFLQDDPMWHFTLEGTYIELRVSKEILALDKFLKDKKWKHSKFEYKDNIDITRKYQKQFEHIFHGYSELSMLVPRKNNVDWEIEYTEVKQVLERCMHLACNILGFSAGGEVKTLAQFSLERAYMNGKFSVGLSTFYEARQKDKKKPVVKKRSRLKV